MAHRFQFRLEVVRRVREKARDTQQRAVAQRIRAVTGVEEHIRRLNRSVTTAVDESRTDHRTGVLDTANIRERLRYRNWLHQSIEAANDELDHRKAELKEEQERLAEASKQLKVIEKLRERQWNRYRSELAREEQAASDEASLQMFVRRHRPEKCEIPA